MTMPRWPLLLVALMAIASGPPGRLAAGEAPTGPAPAAPAPASAGPAWDTAPDSWVATDALGRALPGFAECGPRRSDRTVGMFYFLWHGTHVQGGPFDIAKILAQDPLAMQQADSPLWGKPGAFHHWSQSIFGYYLSDDEGVIAKHAQLLADAGVDVIIFDVTNQFTYKPYYMTLLKVFADLRRAGNATPQVAFLCPFGDPQKVLAELWHDLYGPGLYRELWFLWRGKPLILANPSVIVDAQGALPQNALANEAVSLAAGGTLAQSFTAERPLVSVAGSFPTWQTTGAALTLTLRADGPAGRILATRRCAAVADNAALALELASPAPAGTYLLEISQGAGRVGWWTHAAQVYQAGQAFADGQPVTGSRVLTIGYADSAMARLRSFFTFRKPQPDYFQGPTRPDMWSWLEVHPQHVFMNSQGEKEMMAVGVAQNAVGQRLGSMSEPGARGRAFHAGAQDHDPQDIARGLNVAEQWQRARQEDPRFVFVTGWNEWIAGRFAEFNGVRAPVMFVDQFDAEHSRDIEPVQGGFGDDFYYQLVADIRRYKGVRAGPAPCTRRTMHPERGFAEWLAVEPEYRDDIGDPVQRDHPGWNHCEQYVNHSGRNDLVAAKVAYDDATVWFYVRTKDPITPPGSAHWMLLYIDADHDPRSGWLGYDAVVNRTAPSATRAFLERHAGAGYRWTAAADIGYHLAGNELVLVIPRSALGLPDGPAMLDFKWADNIMETGEASDFTLNGDVAPNDRFNYRALLGPRP